MPPGRPAHMEVSTNATSSFEAASHAALNAGSACISPAVLSRLIIDPGHNTESRTFPGPGSDLLPSAPLAIWERVWWR